MDVDFINRIDIVFMEWIPHSSLSAVYVHVLLIWFIWCLWCKPFRFRYILIVIKTIRSVVGPLLELAIGRWWRCLLRVVLDKDWVMRGVLTLLVVSVDVVSRQVSAILVEIYHVSGDYNRLIIVLVRLDELLFRLFTWSWQGKPIFDFRLMSFKFISLGFSIYHYFFVYPHRWAIEIFYLLLDLS